MGRRRSRPRWCPGSVQGCSRDRRGPSGRSVMPAVTRARRPLASASAGRWRFGRRGSAASRSHRPVLLGSLDAALDPDGAVGCRSVPVLLALHAGSPAWSSTRMTGPPRARRTTRLCPTDAATKRRGRARRQARPSSASATTPSHCTIRPPPRTGGATRPQRRVRRRVEGPAFDRPLQQIRRPPASTRARVGRRRSSVHRSCASSS